MTVEIKVEDAVKKFGDNIIIPGLNIEIENGELFTLLGPSGCGKTTLLRMIAGFNSIEGGKIKFNEKVMNNVEPSKRNIGMVFQNYAIFPHMTAADNVAFGLKNQKVKEPTLSKKVKDMLDNMQILHLHDRFPSNMSGGQQQRLALARAIVTQPDVLLMDEPLSNLDAKLRVEMRSIIREIQQEFKITTVYVTHDQEEALAISDRMAIMKDGELQQVGKPVDIYKHPANIFVATFIGNPILLDGEIVIKNGKATVELDIGYLYEATNLVEGLKVGKRVKALVRPNEFYFSEEPGIEGTIVDSAFLGMNIQYKVELANNKVIEILDSDLTREIIPNDTKVNLQITSPIPNVFDSETEESLMTGVGNHE